MVVMLVVSHRSFLLSFAYHQDEKFIVFDASKRESFGWKWGFDVIAGVNHHRKAIACSLVDGKLLGVIK
jgi:hypothetical protein